jgi:hypothetical protein
MRTQKRISYQFFEQTVKTARGKDWLKLLTGAGLAALVSCSSVPPRSVDDQAAPATTPSQPAEASVQSEAAVHNASANTNSLDQPVPPADETNFTLAPVEHRPCLLLDPKDLPGFCRRFKAQPNQPDALKLDKTVLALVSDTDAARREATLKFLADFRTHLGGEPAVQFGYKNNTTSALARCRRFNELLYQYDIIASFGLLTPAEQAEFEAASVAAAKFLIGDDPARFPSPATPNPNGLEFATGFSTCNRWPDQFLGAMLVGLNFPKQPLAKAWVQYGLGQIRYALDHGNWDGAWNEVPRYHDWTMQLFASLFLTVKRRTGVDFFNDPATKALMDWYVRFSSPLIRLPGTTTVQPQGEPTLPVWGDSSYGNHFAACAMYAPQYATSDPALAQRLMWMWRRAGSPYRQGQTSLVFPLLADPGLEDAPQNLQSTMCRRFGYVMLRSGSADPDETAVYMRGGAQGITHKRADLGSIDLFSRGVPLALGSQSGPYNLTDSVWNQSQESNNVVIFGGAPLKRAASGTLVAFGTAPLADYAVADCSRPAGRGWRANQAFRWRRHLLLVKQPDYLVVWDEIDSHLPAEWVLHTTGETLDWESHRIVSRTAYGVDLDIHALLPADTLVKDERIGRFGTAMPDLEQPGKFKGKKDPYPWTLLKYVHIPAAPGADFLTVLHPRTSTGATLTARVIVQDKDGVILEVTLDGRTDRIHLGPSGGSLDHPGIPTLTFPLEIR